MDQSLLNSTFHGQMVAINRCAELYSLADRSEFDLHATAQPCSMGQRAIEWTGIVFTLGHLVSYFS
ncbi:hypothetical protein METHB2_640003 [Candidatus Methylobacter favarea]|uniref:Uncharacterized protein n=1 Tax=Candidatus Methylobacter favarea TaxID=2707345 RepID=A0A8S0WRV1_9GAMM|nr:hypothetical protein [Candidatus Methylobacter favarea]CAA9892291.1 hypothetical protein METHB2_640003 [Candidatus Methylobacter favarea]